mmetsp:Transcript_31237/g.38160  ORF Transcript_31237/g.38160 Transcript_31237/m.38160 type:complete len:96 (+) Transcript_31237:354-641(+)
MSQHPRPRAGVFAARAGLLLHENLINAVLKKPLEHHVPQKHFLSLISTGDKYAVLSKSVFAFEGGCYWKLKDYIDRTWMTTHKEYPDKKEEKEED